MSHAGAVLQLLMFFIAVNFVSGNNDVSLGQRNHEEEAYAILILNVDAKGNLVVPGIEEPLEDIRDVRYYLKQQADDFERAEKGKTEKTTIVLRADPGADYAKIRVLISTCKEVGFKKIQMRAKQKAAK